MGKPSPYCKRPSITVSESWARITPDHPANYWTLKEYANLLRLTKRKAQADRMELRAREVASRNEQLSFLPYVADAAQLRQK